MVPDWTHTVKVGNLPSTDLRKMATNNPDLGSRLAEMMLAALRQAPQAPQRIAQERDPWDGVKLNQRQTDALVKLGWYPNGWKQTEKVTAGPAHLFKDGPRALRFETAIHNTEGLLVFQSRALMCARLCQYGKLHVGDSALICATLGTNSNAESISRLQSALRSALGGRALKRTPDGFFEVSGLKPQVHHDLYVNMFDEIIKG
jgi:hypothetical protein